MEDRGVDRDTGLVEGGYRALSVITADIPSSSLSACISGPACPATAQPAQPKSHTIGTVPPGTRVSRDCRSRRLATQSVGFPRQASPFGLLIPSPSRYFPHHRPWCDPTSALRSRPCRMITRLGVRADHVPG